MVNSEYPILEYDKCQKSLIEPKNLIKPIKNIPKHCVICFFQDIIEYLLKQDALNMIATLKTEMGSHPVYTIQYNNRLVTLFHPGVGAPLAACLFEEVIALGCRKFIACGGAGVLDNSIETGIFLIPVCAIRDEGTSYHYLPPSREVSATPQAVDAIMEVLKNKGIDCRLIKTWTTDGFYRETPQKIQLRKSEGCLTVEMETASLFAVAQYRKVELGQILYSGDLLSDNHWDSRKWTDNCDVRKKLLYIALEACLIL